MLLVSQFEGFRSGLLFLKKSIDAIHCVLSSDAAQECCVNYCSMKENRRDATLCACASILTFGLADGRARNEEISKFNAAVTYHEVSRP